MTLKIPPVEGHLAVLNLSIITNESSRRQAHLDIAIPALKAVGFCLAETPSAFDVVKARGIITAALQRLGEAV